MKIYETFLNQMTSFHHTGHVQIAESNAGWVIEFKYIYNTQIRHKISILYVVWRSFTGEL